MNNLEKTEKEPCKNKYFCLYIILYTPFITFYCFLLSNFMQYKYILMVLSLIIINFILLEYYYLFNKSNYIFHWLLLFLVNILLIIIYRFIWIEGTIEFVNILIIAIVIYIYIMVLKCLMNEFEEEEFIFGVYAYSYGIFFPGSSIIALFIILIKWKCF